MHEQPLGVLNEFLWDLFREASDGYFLCNFDGVLLDTNPTFKQMLGYTAKDHLIDVKLANLSCFETNIAALLTQALTQACQGLRVTLDKFFFKDHLLALHLAPVNFADQPCLLGMLRPASQDEEQLNRERYEVVTTMMSDYAYALAVSYRDDMPSLKIVWLKADFETKYAPFTNFDMDGLYGYWHEFVHPDDIVFLDNQLQNALSGEGSVCEVRILTQSTEYRWVVNIVYPIIEAGHVVRIYGAGRDIHNTKEAYHQLQIAKDEAEAGNRTKAIFLANMSHELRTPLTAIMGYTELLMEDLLVLDNPNYIRDLRNVNFAAQHLYAVIGDLIDYARLETGDLYVTIKAFNINRLIDSVIAVIPDYLQRNGNTLVKHIPPNLGYFYSDQTKVRQILFNLLTNAAKFTENGTITLRIEPTTLNDVAALRFEVTDTGIGIEVDKLNTIFDPFQQADNSMTRRYGGTGLGLALNRSYVQLMHGVIMVKSEVGKGSTFTVILPSTENI